MQAGVSFSQALLDKVPAQARGTACICRRCAGSAAAGSES